MSFSPRLPLFVATLTLLSLALALVFLTGHPIPAAQAQTDTTTTTTTTTVDYDSNDDRLIEISNLAQLNAIRWDLNGDGTADATANNTTYAAAFPNAATGMGCPDGSDADTNPDPCLGYELKSDLTFDSNGDGSVTIADSGGLYWNGGAGWTPMGDARRNPYTGQFQGRGKTISHLFISNSARQYIGLFGAIGRGGNASGVGLASVSIASSRPAVAGALAGSNSGVITTSYAAGTMTITSGSVNANSLAGGLVGHNSLTGAVQASYAEAAVSATHSRAAAITGGLAGRNDGRIQASYATGAVSATGINRFTKAGGLVGNNGGSITASYARGRVAVAGSGAAAGGLVGGHLRNGSVTASYWDTTTSGQTASAGGTGQTSSALQSPMGYNYSGIYAGWNLNLDGVAGGDSPWYFRGADQYPILAYGTMREFPLWDYDTDNDRLLEVDNLAQLDAIRWDLNADGTVDAAADRASYTAAFPGAVTGMGCAQGATAAACNGYELLADLDFDTDGDGDVDAADSGGRYWNGGAGWHTIGNSLKSLSSSFRGTFQGNGKTIANLHINYPANHPQSGWGGLFGYMGPTGVIDGVNLRDVDIHIHSGVWIATLVAINKGTVRSSSATGRIHAVRDVHYAVAGGLVADNSGSITNSYAKVEIEGGALWVGGLAAYNAARYGSINASYSSGAAITSGSNSNSPSPNGASPHVGGLVGENNGTITDSYSRSPVKATGSNAAVGGLVGSGGNITASYATGSVTATGTNSYVGGLTGYGATITASYATGSVTATGANSYVGGLVGRGGATASYATGPVVATGNNSSVGGLAGENRGEITAAYSRSPVKATGNGAKVGGLVGDNAHTYRDVTTNTTHTYPGIITASYAIGPVVATGTNPLVGGLVGKNVGLDSSGKEVANSKGTAVDSYWDTDVSGQSSSALGTGVRGRGMLGSDPSTYGGIYANWNLNLDGVAGNDDPWHFASGQYPMLDYGGLAVADQVHLYLWDAPRVGGTARTAWNLGRWLTRTRGQEFVWERSGDGVTWTVIRSRTAGVGGNRYHSGSSKLIIEPYEAGKRFRVRGHSVEGGRVYSIVSTPAPDWSGPTATLTFASGHTTPRVGQAIAISGTNNVRWIRCDDTAGNGCEVLVRAATGYTPVAADQGKYLYAYRYYDNSDDVKTLGKTGYIGPVAAAAATP